MRNFFRRFRRRLIGRKPLRRFRPLFEGLENRELLAFNVSISTNPTANVSVTTTATTKTFTATGSGANVNASDITSAISPLNHLSVVIDTGSTGSQAGDITQSSDISTTNAANTGLTLNAA